MDFRIEDIGIAPMNPAEYTSGAVLKRFSANMAILKGIYDRRAAVDSIRQAEDPDHFVPSPPLTVTDFNNLMGALTDLRDLAKNGVTDGTPPLTFYLTTEMAINLNAVIKSLKAAGIMMGTTYTDSLKVGLLEGWQSLAGFGVQDIMNNAAGVSTNAVRTAQSMVELEFVKRGNDILSDKFSLLEDSLQIAKDILKTLTVVQGVSNQITVTMHGDFAFPPTNTNQIPSDSIDMLATGFAALAPGAKVPTLGTAMLHFKSTYLHEVDLAHANATANGTTFSAELSQLTGASNVINQFLVADWTVTSGKPSTTKNFAIGYYTNVYRTMASAQFKQVMPTAIPTDTAASELIKAKQDLMKLLVELEKLPPSDGRPVQTRAEEGTLANFIFRVATDISNAFTNIDLSSGTLQADLKAAVSKWILDGQDKKISMAGAENAGLIQQRITQAIKAAESLNDTEKENVRNYQYIFEQFYKSASVVLQRLTEMIEKIAQGISS